MRIMLDTNILISMFAFKSQIMIDLFESVTSEHDLVLCDYILKEFESVTARKYPLKFSKALRFLSAIDYELVHCPKENLIDAPQMRNVNDQPILNAAILNGIDIFITGDKDFLAIRDLIQRPKIITPSEYLRVR